ncbi:MAG: hypothetical protein WD766_03735 [Gemmatimonadota bacterium]
MVEGDAEGDAGAAAAAPGAGDEGVGRAGTGAMRGADADAAGGVEAEDRRDAEDRGEVGAGAGGGSEKSSGLAADQRDLADRPEVPDEEPPARSIPAAGEGAEDAPRRRPERDASVAAAGPPESSGRDEITDPREASDEPGRTDTVPSPEPADLSTQESERSASPPSATETPGSQQLPGGAPAEADAPASSTGEPPVEPVRSTSSGLPAASPAEGSDSTAHSQPDSGGASADGAPEVQPASAEPAAPIGPPADVGTTAPADGDDGDDRDDRDDGRSLLDKLKEIGPGS